jgi:hypothetical protein
MARKSSRSTDELSLDDLAKELQHYSGQISTLIRSTGLAVLGIDWLLLLKKSEVASIAREIPETLLLVIAAVGVLALVADMLQYVFGHRVSEETFDRAVASPSKAAAYDAASFAYRAQDACFKGKISLTVLATVLLLIAIGRALI